jgi:hypothetical protein
MDARMAKKDHPAHDLINAPGAKITKTPVDISDLKNRADKNRALRVVEQDVMDATGNVPGQPGSRNKIRALTPEKQEEYRQNYNTENRVK